MKKYINISLIAFLGAFGLASCTYAPVEPDNSTPWEATYTVTEFLNTYMTQNGKLTPVRPNSGDAGLYSVDTLPVNGPDIILTGRVVSSDEAGNIYKSMTIQDLEEPTTGIKISVDASGLSARYAAGQIISIKCNGLAVGKYADMAQLGVPYYNNDENSAKRGWEPGRMPLNIFVLNSHAAGIPDPASIVYTEMTIAEINAAATNRSLHSRVVKIKNAHFTGKGYSFGSPVDLSDAEKIFAPSTNGIGYPQSREITDGTASVAIATSEYAKFANIKLPPVEYAGDIYAIIGWYKDKATGTGSIQLTIRSLDDLKLLSTEDGSAWVPTK